MSFRFKKSIKLAPGIRWNLSGSGSSFTLGPRGASLNTGSRGSFVNTSIPDTGLYSRRQLSGSESSTTRQHQSLTTIKLICGLQDDGSIYFLDQEGHAVSEKTVEIAKKTK